MLIWIFGIVGCALVAWTFWWVLRPILRGENNGELSGPHEAPPGWQAEVEISCIARVRDSMTSPARLLIGLDGLLVTGDLFTSVWIARDEVVAVRSKATGGLYFEDLSGRLGRRGLVIGAGSGSCRSALRSNGWPVA
jgi:hypothetical protein